MQIRYLALLPMLATAALLSPLTRAQVPIFAVTPVEGTIEFNVKASVPIAGHFDKWDATLTFTSPDVTTAVLDIKIQAASVNTGSGMKNNKLKGKDFFNVEQDPLITFKSTKVVQTGPTTFDVPGTFAIRASLTRKP
jgi:polyisoprenoid-binding protein YceI